MPSKNNILLKNGHVVDPLNDVDSVSDVLILDGKISKVSKDIVPENEDIKVIDVSGKVVVPGLID
ncbi:MAG: hypothetical protein ACYSR0_09630 [Planctomycetota bacterium]|jgi:dihydroorotase